MEISVNTTVREILEARLDAIKVFEKHGVDVKLECDESLWDSELQFCDSMCHIDNLDALIRDLKSFLNTAPVEGQKND